MIVSRSGLAVCVLVVATASLRAQEAQPSGPAAAPSACSGWTCLFSADRRSAPAPAAPAAPAAPIAEAAQPTPVTVASVKADAPVKKAAKPAHVVTVAADPADVARLKALATPGFHLRFVERADKQADFIVKTAFGTAGADAGAKLFSLQMHVVAGASIHSMADLRDKVVSFGLAGSPTQFAARKAFAALAVPVKETPLDLDNALDGLTTGDIDAVVVLAPQPARTLADIKGTGLHLIAWPDGSAMPDGASPGTIPAASYPRLAAGGSALRVASADAVLAMNARGARQTEAKAFLASLGQHSATLSKRGFDLLRADLADRRGRHVASVEHR